MREVTRMPETMFIGHKYIDDYSETTGFEQYLLIETAHQAEAFEIDDSTPLDLEKLLAEAAKELFDADSVTIEPENGGSNYAAIITDGRPPSTCVVWESCNVYLED